MIDTLKLVSPALESGSATSCEAGLKRYSQIDIASGHVEYEITRGSLAGTFDHQVSVRLDWREEVITEGSDPVSIPRMTIEGSVHKALLGHNVHGGPVDPVAAGRWLVADVARRLGVELPDGAAWEVARIDESSAYLLPSPAAVSEYIWGLNQCQFPRRSPNRYGRHGIMISGTTTTIKMYHKGPEFTLHDVPRLRAAGWPSLLETQLIADRILRVEVEIKAKALKRDFGGVRPKLAQLTTEYLQKIHDQEVNKMLKSAQNDYTTVRTTLDVSRRLEQVYPGTIGRHLFCDWLSLCALGEFQYRRSCSPRSWYRTVEKLKAAGVSWLASDVRVAEQSIIPLAFEPSRDDSTRLTSVSEIVMQLTQQYSLHA